MASTFFSFSSLKKLALTAAVISVSVPGFSYAQHSDNDVLPLPLRQLELLEREEDPLDPLVVMPTDIRREAIREAATSYGARGGLAWSTYAISKELQKRDRYLDKVFNFAQLLIPAPSGLLIEPPIITQSTNAMIIEYGAQEAAVSDRIYNIVSNARIVTAPHNWRQYLERSWGSEIDPPPDILRPADDEEREIWIKYVNLGWKEGIVQAEEIFAEDLALLTADFQGMVRYRLLLSQGMISPPRALQVDRGVTGDGSEMRIGDRAIQITGVPQLLTGSDEWKPANR